MTALWACLVLCPIGHEHVRLHLVGGEVIQGELREVDSQGRYVVTDPGGKERRIPYRSVSDVELLQALSKQQSTVAAEASWPEYPRAGNLAVFVAQHIAELAGGSPPGARADLAKAVELLRGGDLKNALAAVGEALREAPGMSAGLLFQAALSAETGNLQGAAHSIERYLDLVGPEPIGLSVAAEIAYRRGLPTLGDKWYAQAIGLRTEGAERSWRLGHFYLQRGAPEAAKHFAAYLAADPQLRGSFSVEGRILRRARAQRDAGRLTEAACLYALLLRRSPYIGRRFSQECAAVLTQRAEKLRERGYLGAALHDLKEACFVAPEKEPQVLSLVQRLKRELFRRTCGEVRSLRQLHVLSGHMGKTGGTGEVERRHLAEAYGRLCAEALAAGDVQKAVRCFHEAKQREIRLTDLPVVRRALAGVGENLSPEAAEKLTECLGQIHPEYLRSECRFLLTFQLRTLRKILKRGGVSSAAERLSRLEKLFGGDKELARLKQEFQFLSAARPTEVATETGEPTALTAEVLSRFPTEVGRWWQYKSSAGRVERWRVERVQRSPDCTQVTFVGESSGSSGPVALKKLVFLTDRGIYAGGRDPESGGRVLLWDGDHTRVEIRSPNKREVVLHERSATVQAGGRTFGECWHVQVRTSLVDPLTDDTRFSVVSHYWYAPEVGLVRIETDAQTVWELENWGIAQGARAEQNPRGAACSEPVSVPRNRPVERAGGD